MLIHNKDDIEFVTEFPCFLGHPVYYIEYSGLRSMHVTGKYITMSIKCKITEHILKSIKVYGESMLLENTACPTKHISW